MEWLWILCGLMCAWATLRIIGGERERRVNHLLIELSTAPPQPAPAKSGK